MKKIYVLIVCLTHLTSLFCMEKPRKENLFTSYAEDSNAFSLITFKSTADYQQIPLTANEPGWEKFNEIANIKSTRYSISEPITQYTNSWIKTTVPLTLDVHTTQLDLYKKAEKFMETELSGDKDQKLTCLLTNLNTQYHPQKSHLLSLINATNDAKNKDISEDMMSDFAYKQTPTFFSHSNINSFIALLFNLLKTYNATVEKQPESFPYTSPYNSTEILNVSSPISFTLGSNKILDYPAFIRLIFDLTFILAYRCPAITLTKCLYSDVTISPHYSGHFSQNIEEIYEKLYLFLIHPSDESPYSELYDILESIEQPKIKKDFSDKTEWTKKIFSLHFTPSAVKSYYHNYMYQDYNATFTKNSIALFCILIKQYNDLRNLKKTPTPEQYQARHLQERITLALPHNFTNTILDENHYAFKEILNLIVGFNALVVATFDEVQQYINKHI